MKVLYLDCSMGAAGDMLSAALLELLPNADRERFVGRLNSLGLPGVTFRAEPAEKCGIAGTHMQVLVNGMAEESTDDGDGRGRGDSFKLDEYASGCSRGHDCGNGHDRGHDRDDDHDNGHDCDDDHERDDDHDDDNERHHDHDNDRDRDRDDDHERHEREPVHHRHVHRSLSDIDQMVSHLDVPEAVKGNVLAVYNLIAQAESHAHGCLVEEVHFHEVGSMDAIADVTAVCLLLHELAPARVAASPVHVGSGQVRCAHGVLPVPAPATAWLLQGVPTYGGRIKGELCTPTGAALLKHFVREFGSQPPMCVERIGYGCGQKDFEAANCVRALLGDALTAGVPPKSTVDAGTAACGCDDVLELRCNVDDMTPEAIGFALEELLAAGALDAFTIPIGMKKSRPGTLLTCLCRADRREQMVRLLFLHTTTLGVRETPCHRYTLDRSVETVQTEYGLVRIKVASGWGIQREKSEYEDLARIARQQGISLSRVNEAVATCG